MKSKYLISTKAIFPILLIISVLTPVINSTSTSPDSGTLLWKSTVSGVFRDLLYDTTDPDRNAIVVTTLSPLITSLDGDSGSFNWRNQEIKPINSDDDAEHNDAILMDINNDDNREILTTGYTGSIFDSTGIIQAYDFDNGSLLWQLKLGLEGTCLGNYINTEQSSQGVICSYQYANNESQKSSAVSLIDLASFNIIWNRSLTKPSAEISRCDGVDLNSDGISDIVLTISISSLFNAGTPYYGIEVYDGSDFSLLWNVSQTDRIVDIQYRDMNDNQYIDLVCTGTSLGVMCFDGSDGTVIWSSPSTGGYITKIADLDQDGKDEVVVGYLEHLAILEAENGAIIIQEELESDLAVYNITCANLVGDEKLELVCSSFNGGVYILDHSFEVLETFQTTGATFSVFFTDVNSDGVTELVAGAKGPESHVYVYLTDIKSQGSVSTSSWYALEPLILSLLVVVGLKRYRKMV